MTNAIRPDHTDGRRTDRVDHGGVDDDAAGHPADNVHDPDGYTRQTVRIVCREVTKLDALPISLA